MEWFSAFYRFTTGKNIKSLIVSLFPLEKYLGGPIVMSFVVFKTWLLIGSGYTITIYAPSLHTLLSMFHRYYGLLPSGFISHFLLISNIGSTPFTLASQLHLFRMI